MGNLEKNKLYLMECGHISNAQDSKGNPVCVICLGAHEGAEIIKKEITDPTEGLGDRKAKCSYRHTNRDDDGITDSRWDLPFFKYRPDQEYDQYYCGCHGWD